MAGRHKVGKGEGGKVGQKVWAGRHGAGRSGRATGRQARCSVAQRHRPTHHHVHVSSHNRNGQEGGWVEG